LNQERKQPTPQILPPEEPQIDPATQALLDLLAPGLGAKNGKELAEKLKGLESKSQNYERMAQEQEMSNQAIQFFRTTPDFVVTDANTAKVDAMMTQFNLPYTVANLKFVHNSLKGAGEYENAVAAPVEVPRGTNGQFAKQNNMPLPPAASAPAAAPAAPDVWTLSDADFEKEMNKRRVG
jgi:hypothetical protein